MISGRFLAVSTLAALASLALAPTALGKWVIRGHAFGHGVGLSQYGAYGYAQHGRGYRWILTHYYRHTDLGHANRDVRVLLDAGVDPVRFTSAGSACGHQLNPDREYRFERNASGVVLKRSSGELIEGCGQAGRAKGGIVTVLGQGDYRGVIEARTWSGSGLELINELGVDPYVRGVVANEMPSSWAKNALRAQAVAARSYALATGLTGDFDVYDDTRSQVYGGADTETAATNDAVHDTRHEVVRFNGAIATTYFFSTSGGRTENVEFGFPGSSPQPYLKGVRDRYDGISPYHSWHVRYTGSQMRSRLAGLFSGRLRRIRILEQGTSPRILKARVVGSESSSTVSGATLQSRLALLSNWARFRRPGDSTGGGGTGSGGGIAPSAADGRGESP